MRHVVTASKWRNELTARLYFDDPHRTTFEAHITATRQSDAGWEVALDQTCFYPTGGGQPHDLGTLGGLRVLDVREEDGVIWHVLPGRPADSHVIGEIDWPRRFDHMQQHTGQHILSAVALDQLGAETVSFHLGSESATIDLNVADLSSVQVEALEAEVNRLVTSAIPVRAFIVAPEDIPGLNLRKLPTKGEQPRIVKVAGVDASPCGGTHVRNTGEIGLVKIRRLERYKGGTRIEFLCGGRALGDYQWKHVAIMSLARDLSVADRDVEEAIRRTLAGEKEARRQVEQLQEQLLIYEAEGLRRAARPYGSFCLAVRSFPERAPAEVKRLAGLLTAQPSMIALLASEAPSARLFFMRSADVDLDMRRALQEVTSKYGGGGGGRPQSAEGGGIPPAEVAAALSWAADWLLADRGMAGHA